MRFPLYSYFQTLIVIEKGEKCPDVALSANAGLVTKPHPLEQARQYT